MTDHNDEPGMTEADMVETLLIQGPMEPEALMEYGATGGDIERAIEQGAIELVDGKLVARDADLFGDEYETFDATGADRYELTPDDLTGENF